MIHPGRLILSEKKVNIGGRDMLEESKMLRFFIFKFYLLR